ncbi:hypothetical protein HanIR_Chr05g0255601 [Helianthus annuus]|nr:hypothetical protein HanIR_Chr05g0255601 [Helianthus annuus]
MKIFKGYQPLFEITLSICFRADRVSILSCCEGTDCNKKPRIENPERLSICCWLDKFSSKTEAISSMISAVKRSFVMGVSKLYPSC